MKTKIAWCSPFSPSSSVGEFSHSIVESVYCDPALSKRCQLDVFVNRNGPAYSTAAPRYDLDSFNNADTLKLLGQTYDHFIYNLGNNVENHAQIFSLAENVPGIGIMHDYVYQHYFANQIFEEHQAPKIYPFLMGKYYGAEALRSVFSSRILSNTSAKFGLWDTDLAGMYPLMEAVISSAPYTGIVVHSEMSHELVKKVYDGPILKLRLPGDEKELLPEEAIQAWKLSTSSKRRTSAAIIGHIQRGKQIHFVIETLVRFPELREHLHSLTIAGKPSDAAYVNEIQTKIITSGLNDIINVELNVSHRRLQEIKNDADIFINIRFPNTEGGSGSLIEQMATNKPTIVLNTGIFREIESGVIKISSPMQHSELRDAIVKLSTNARARIALGNEARKYTQQLLSKDYAREIIDFCKTVVPRTRNLKPQRATLSPAELFTFDAHVRTPSPIFEWTLEAFREFATILFAPYFRKDLVSFLATISSNDPVLAYRTYSFARSLIDILEDKYVQLTAPRLWLLPKRLTAHQIRVISLLTDTTYLYELWQDIGAERAPTHQLKTLKKFSAEDPFSSLMVCQLATELLGSNNELLDKRLEVFDIDVEKRGALLRAVQLMRNMVDLDDTKLKKLIVSIGPKVFDTAFYIAAHEDLGPKSGVHEGNAYSHFVSYGQHEDRRFRILPSGLMSALLEKSNE